MTSGWGGNWHLMALWGCSDSCLSLSGCQVERLALLLWGRTWCLEYWPLLSVTALPHPLPSPLNVDHPACIHCLLILEQWVVWPPEQRAGKSCRPFSWGYSGYILSVLSSGACVGKSRVLPICCVIIHQGWFRERSIYTTQMNYPIVF